MRIVNEKNICTLSLSQIGKLDIKVKIGPQLVSKFFVSVLYGDHPKLKKTIEYVQVNTIFLLVIHLMERIMVLNWKRLVWLLLPSVSFWMKKEQQQFRNDVTRICRCLNYNAKPLSRNVKSC